MYTERIRLYNYGPLETLDINFPFDNGRPLPVLIVGANGTGKSVLLSHIVNGLLTAQSAVYPNSPEVEDQKVYKLRSNSYIPSEHDWYYGRVYFQDRFFSEELRLRRDKRFYSESPVAHLSGGEPQQLWDKMEPTDYDAHNSNLGTGKRKVTLRALYEENTILHFPPNRFEDPAWLNREHLCAAVQFLDIPQIEGYTARKVLDYTPLRDNQDWLFQVMFDRSLLNPATSRHANALSSAIMPIFRQLIGEENVVLGFGPRYNRTMSIERTTDDGRLIQNAQRLPNVFHLSSGETNVLNIALSILRDFDLARRRLIPGFSLETVRGIAVIDEVDLHLHGDHQYKLLPKILKLFPNVQFIMTTHSPFLPLGMQREFGNSGFAIYELPKGNGIAPEEFSEFGRALEIFSQTRTFAKEIRAAVEQPTLYVEGPTDTQYIQQAAEHLSKQHLLDQLQLKAGAELEGSETFGTPSNYHTQTPSLTRRYCSSTAKKTRLPNRAVATFTTVSSHRIQITPYRRA